jgi:hypothetical protein
MFAGVNHRDADWVPSAAIAPRAFTIERRLSLILWHNAPARERHE